MKKQLTKQLDALDLELQKLMEEFSTYTREQLDQAPGPDKWSVLQLIQHVMKAEELSLAYLKKKLSFNPTLKKAGMATAFRNWLLKLYLVAPLKFNAPKAVGSETFESDVSLEDLGKRWQAQRSELRKFLLELPDELLDKEVYKHPFAGRLDLMGMVGFFKDHFHRHLGQMQQALKRLE